MATGDEYMSKYDRIRAKIAKGQTLTPDEESFVTKIKAPAEPPVSVKAKEHDKEERERLLRKIEEEKFGLKSSKRGKPYASEYMKKYKEKTERAGGEQKLREALGESGRHSSQESGEQSFREKMAERLRGLGKTVKAEAIKTGKEFVDDVKQGMKTSAKSKQRSHPVIEEEEAEAEPVIGKKKKEIKQNVRVNSESNEIEIVSSSGDVIRTGKKATVQIPASFVSKGVVYEPEPTENETVDYQVTETYATSPEEAKKQQEMLYDLDNPLGKRLPYREPKILLGTYTPPVQEYSDVPQPQPVRQKRAAYAGRAGIYGAGLGAITSGQYASTFAPMRAPVAQPVGRNPLVRAQPQPQPVEQPMERSQAPRQDNRSASSILFGNGSSYGIRNTGGLKSLFSNNIDVLVGSRQQRPEQPQQSRAATSANDLFGGNMSVLGSGVTTMFGAKKFAGDGIIGVVSGGAMPTVFGLSKAKQTVSPAVIPVAKGDENMQQGMIELFRSSKPGIVKVLLTENEYRTLAQQRPGSIGFYRVQGSKKPVLKAYLAPQDVSALQAQGRIALVPKGRR